MLSNVIEYFLQKYVKLLVIFWLVLFINSKEVQHSNPTYVLIIQKESILCLCSCGLPWVSSSSSKCYKEQVSSIFKETISQNKPPHIQTMSKRLSNESTKQSQLDYQWMYTSRTVPWLQLYQRALSESASAGYLQSGPCAWVPSVRMNDTSTAFICKSI